MEELVGGRAPGTRSPDPDLYVWIQENPSRRPMVHPISTVVPSTVRRRDPPSVLCLRLGLCGQPTREPVWNREPVVDQESFDPLLGTKSTGTRWEVLVLWSRMVNVTCEVKHSVKMSVGEEVSK